ncbi:MAG TPA: recombinase family protein [Bryobacteraceae bacterium]|jgi:site-specific DNA recombinase
MAEKIRCAIYTRKSTEEGLDQEFNSLGAQREAAEAFIKSQRHQGWTQVTQHYDDGGFTGGSLERPALKRLLEDIDAQRIQCVVVYKVDRLSRSLLGFARLIDRFEQRSVSFVSVTQQFNTTTSLGRLTLNILLSFAQFEREIIGERTRDKMSAARRKGKWTGGTPVLGYDVDPRGGGLMVNEKEAQRVREIFRLYESHGSITAVLEELEKRRWTTKSWMTKQGSRRLGRPFTKATLRRLLGNAVYIGKVEHKGVLYAGEHAAIVDTELGEKVNAQLRAAARGENGAVRTPQNALLRGVLYCGSCSQPMAATYTAHGGRRYSYYVCRVGKSNNQSCPAKSIAARFLEQSVIEQVRSALHAPDAREQLHISESEAEAFAENDSGEWIRSVVRRVVYDAAREVVSVELGR